MHAPSPDTPVKPREPRPDRYAFSCAFYLFGMVITAPAFAFLALKRADPTWGKWFPQGWIDPSLALVVMPVIGAIVGFFLVLFANLVYLIVRKKRP